jgi:hypothetical protein
MLRRRSTSFDSTDASAYSRREAIADSLWSAQDRIRNGAGAVPGGLFAAVRGPFERVAYGFEERLLWPLQDRTATMGAPARTLSFGAAVLLAAAAGVAGLVWAAPEGAKQTATTRVAAAPAPTEATPPVEKPAEPTLQGAAPVFEPAESRQASQVDSDKAIVGSTPSAGESEAAPEEDAPAAGAAATSSSIADPRSGPELDGPPAGPEAIAVARDFAGAFLLYETGETDSTVREAFGETATPALARALLKRPPRLPAGVEVPKAKVLNVVAAPSQGDVYPVSVSLLRVGLTSELRLDMERRKGEGWRVTNVLG